MIYVIYYTAEHEDRYPYCYVDSEEGAKKLVDNFNRNVSSDEDDFKWHYYFLPLNKVEVKT